MPDKNVLIAICVGILHILIVFVAIFVWEKKKNKGLSIQDFFSLLTNDTKSNSSSDLHNHHFDSDFNDESTHDNSDFDFDFDFSDDGGSDD